MCLNHLHSFQPYAARNVTPESSRNGVGERAGASLFRRVYFDSLFVLTSSQREREARRRGAFLEILYPGWTLEAALGLGG